MCTENLWDEDSCEIIKALYAIASEKRKPALFALRNTHLKSFRTCCRFGRQPVILLNVLVVIIAGCMTLITRGYITFLLFRMLFAVGMHSIYNAGTTLRKDPMRGSN